MSFTLIHKCDYEFCDNHAEYWDAVDSPVCGECMEREIQEGSAKPEDFESIEQ